MEQRDSKHQGNDFIKRPSVLKQEGASHYDNMKKSAPVISCSEFPLKVI